MGVSKFAKVVSYYSVNRWRCGRHELPGTVVESIAERLTFHFAGRVLFNTVEKETFIIHIQKFEMLVYRATNWVGRYNT